MKMNPKPARDFNEVNRLVTENINLAHFFAQKWAWKLGEDDALSIALEGLHKAAQEHDPARGTKFGTFAGLRIKWCFSKHRVRANTKKRGGGIANVSLDAPVGEDGGSTVGDLVMDENAETSAQEVEFSDQQQHLRGLLGKLTDREAQIITARFGLDGEEKKTLDEIALGFGLTRERVRQLQEQALNTLAKLTKTKRVRKPRRAEAKPVSATTQKIRALEDDYWSEENAQAKPPVTAKIKYHRAYREANREKIRAYFAGYCRRNKDAIRAYRARAIERIRKYRLLFYYRHRERICAGWRERYASDEVFAEAARQRTRAWLANNRERAKANKVIYREKNREKLRKHALKYSANLSPNYVRQQLWKRNGMTRARESFTFDEIEDHRAHLAQRRMQLTLRPKCPKCSGPGRKDGHFSPSGRQRYSCRRGCGVFSLPRGVSVLETKGLT